MELFKLGIKSAKEGLEKGDFSSVELVKSVIDRVHAKDGEIGAFVLNGEYLVKQLLRDHLGNLYLLSLNRAEADRDVTLWASAAEYTQLIVLGTILTDQKIPLPRI